VLDPRTRPCSLLSLWKVEGTGTGTAGPPLDLAQPVTFNKRLSALILMAAVRINFEL